MLQILQARLQQYMNREFPDVQDGFRKGRGTRDQIASLCWIIDKAREFQRNIYFCFIDYAKAFDWLLLNHAKTPGFLAPRGEEFNPGPETRLDCSELLWNKVLLKYKGDRESF